MFDLGNEDGVVSRIATVAQSKADTKFNRGCARSRMFRCDLFGERCGPLACATSSTGPRRLRESRTWTLASLKRTELPYVTHSAWRLNHRWKDE
eukprot:93173-Amphidinium_carterae.3